MRRLVLRLNEYWGIFVDEEGNHFPFPLKPIYCPVCGSELLLHDFRSYRHRAPDGDLCHVDVHVKCPNCGSWWVVEQERLKSPTVFGLPVPCDLVPKLQNSKYHGKVLRWELKELYGDKLPKEVTERLKRWGYL